MAYGTMAGIAAHSKMWTDNGEFTNEDCLDCLQTESTNPTLNEVRNWHEQISNAMDEILAGEGFAVPVTNEKAVSVLAMQVERWVADLVHEANRAGRFATQRAIENGITGMKTIEREVQKWAQEHATGLANLGADRTASAGDTIITKDTTPIFSRRGFGNRFESWPDTDD